MSTSLNGSMTTKEIVQALDSSRTRTGAAGPVNMGHSFTYVDIRVSISSYFSFTIPESGKRLVVW